MRYIWTMYVKQKDLPREDNLMNPILVLSLGFVKLDMDTQEGETFFAV